MLGRSFSRRAYNDVCSSQHHQDYLSHYSRIRGYLFLSSCRLEFDSKRQPLILPVKDDDYDYDDDDDDGKLEHRHQRQTSATTISGKNIEKYYLFVYLQLGNVIAFECRKRRSPPAVSFYIDLSRWRHREEKKPCP